MPVAAATSPSNQKPALPFDEEIPPGGVDNLMFSDAAIRYCLAQIIRIDAVRSLVDRYERAQVDYFNGLVVDYNNRCAHYRYMEGARESAQAIVEPNRAKLESDARDAYRKRFAAPAKDIASKTSSRRVAVVSTAAASHPVASGDRILNAFASRCPGNAAAAPGGEAAASANRRTIAVCAFGASCQPCSNDDTAARVEAAALISYQICAIDASGASRPFGDDYSAD